MTPPDDIRPEDLEPAAPGAGAVKSGPAAPPAKPGAAPSRLREVHPESEVRGGPESPDAA